MGDVKIEFDSFVEEAVAQVKHMLGDNYRVFKSTDRKNNDVLFHSICIADKKGSAVQRINLNSYYQLYRQLGDMPVIAADIINVYRNRRLNYETDWLRDRDKVLERVFFSIVNMEKNKELFKEAPHYDIPELKLSVMFHIMVQAAGNGFESILIRKRNMAYWGITEEELLKYAWKNTPVQMAYMLKSMWEVLSSIQEKLEILACLPHVYVLSNEKKIFGAGSLLYEGVLDIVAEKFTSGFYVLPCSIHEVIVIPAESLCKEEACELKGVVVSVNQTIVEKEEVLSDYVYYYNRTKHELVIAA